MVDIRDFSWAVRYLFCIVKVTFLSCVRQHHDLLDSQSQNNYESSQIKGNRVPIHLWLPPRKLD